ncbi:MAG: CPBP family intramembrane metalloprotease [Reichenbachiella sp.]
MTNSFQSSRSPIILLVILVSMALGAYLILPNILILIMAGLTGTSLQDLVSAMNATDPQEKFQWILMAVQVIASGISFILVPIIFIKKVSKERVAIYFDNSHHTFPRYAILYFMAISFMVVNSIFIEWNMSLTYPEPFHTKFVEMEKAMEQATNFLTDFKSLPYFLVAFIAIAIIPAIGEELLFRGLIQKYASQIFGNVHVAIWLTALVFSAFHLQFFGFLPRMLLGAFFGYMVYFSGSLWYGIAAHFVNNGMTILILYLHQQGVVDFDIENTESFSLDTVAIFAIIGVILMVLFIKQFQKDIISKDE